jgi:peptidoglycan/LPS O-acetylase OafA/YrhL
MLASSPGSLVASAYLFVDLFFILSGFVMSHAYEQKLIDGMPFVRYALLRMGRLYPLHLFAHLFYALHVVGKGALYTMGVGNSDPGASAHMPSFFSNLFLLQAFGLHDRLYWNRPSWSISAELGAYAVFFLSARWLGRRGRLPILGLIVAIYAGLLLWSDRRLDVTYDLGFLRCIAGFYTGVLLFQFRARPAAWLERLSTPVLTAVELACVIAIAACVSLVPRGDGYVVAVLICFAASIVVFSSRRSGSVGAIASGPLMRKLGLWSYSIYLLHLLFFDVAGNLVEYGLDLDVSQGIGPIAIVFNAVVMAAVILASGFSYRWIEKPLRDGVKLRVAAMGAGGKPPHELRPLAARWRLAGRRHVEPARDVVPTTAHARRGRHVPSSRRPR